MAYPLENALFQWEDGFRRLQELREDPGAYRRAGRAVTAIQDELRRRIGPTFGAEDLAELYGNGTDWCQRAAFDAVPGDPGAWDGQVVIDAAFFLYLRGATDFAGGKRLVPD